MRPAASHARVGGLPNVELTQQISAGALQLVAPHATLLAGGGGGGGGPASGTVPLLLVDDPLLPLLLDDDDDVEDVPPVLESPLAPLDVEDEVAPLLFSDPVGSLANSDEPGAAKRPVSDAPLQAWMSRAAVTDAANA